MGGLAQTARSDVWRPARSTTYSTTPLGITPVQGFGTGRLFIYSNKAGTVSILQKPRDDSSQTFTFRQTDSYSVAAAGTTQVFDFNVRADYCEVTFAPTGDDPTVWEFEATFYP